MSLAEDSLFAAASAAHWALEVVARIARDRGDTALMETCDWAAFLLDTGITQVFPDRRLAPAPSAALAHAGREESAQ